MTCFATSKFLLTSWFSWNSTRYSERCCRMNFLMTSCLIRGSSTLATRQASRRTLLGPTDLYMQKIRHWFGAKQGDAGEDTSGEENEPWIPVRGRLLQNLPGSESPTRSGLPSPWKKKQKTHRFGSLFKTSLLAFNLFVVSYLFSWRGEILVWNRPLMVFWIFLADDGGRYRLTLKVYLLIFSKSQSSSSKPLNKCLRISGCTGVFGTLAKLHSHSY